MVPGTNVPPPPWWRLRRLEQVALALGAVIGLGACAPLVWLSAEAQRTGHTELTAASHLYPGELLLVWLCGALVGGIVAAQLARRLRSSAATASVAVHLLRLAGGVALSALLGPLPLALIAMAVTRQPATFSLYYLSSGGLVGWQPGGISFVFLYTFRALELQRNSNGCGPGGPRSQ